MRFAHALLLLSLTTLFITGCPDDKVTENAPTIYADVCKTPEQKFRDKVVGGIEDCLLDFADSDIAVDSHKEFTITNTTVIDLHGPTKAGVGVTDMKVYMAEGSDPAFKVEVAPTSVGRGLSEKIRISLRAKVEGEIKGKIIIESDAKNLPAGKHLEIEVVANGVDNGIPKMVITPENCDFGRIAAGAVSDCHLKITNEGTRDLVFDDFYLMDKDSEGNVLPQVPAGSMQKPFDFPSRPLVAGDIIPAGDNNSVTVQMQFRPDRLGSYIGKLMIKSNDPEAEEVMVGLQGLGVDPPTCNIKIKSVNGSESFTEIKVLDDVIFTAVDSEASTATGAIQSTRWEFAAKPSTSTMNFTNPTGVETGFAFSSGSATSGGFNRLRQGIDIVGDYVIRAYVKDELGTESINPCELTIKAVPSESFLIELTWETSNDDVDLHLTPKDSMGRYCIRSISSEDFEEQHLSEDCSDPIIGDCFYGSCRATAGNRPDWDNDGDNLGLADPRLNLDDTDGYGPEQITIAEAATGSYLVGVDYFSGTSTGVVLRIYLHGQLAHEFYRENLVSSELWEVAILHWKGRTANSPSSYCVESIELMLAHPDMPQCDEFLASINDGTDPVDSDAGVDVDAGTDPVDSDAGVDVDAGSDPIDSDAGSTTDAGN